MARRTPGIRSHSVRTGSTGSAIVGRAKTGGIRSPHTQHRGRAMEAARRATGHVGKAQQTIRSGIGGKLAKVGTAARAFNQRKRNVAQASNPQIKKGLALPTGGRNAPAMPGTKVVGLAGRTLGGIRSPAAQGGASQAIRSLSRPLKRKSTRGSGRFGGR